MAVWALVWSLASQIRTLALSPQTQRPGGDGNALRKLGRIIVPVTCAGPNPAANSTLVPVGSSGSEEPSILRYAERIWLPQHLSCALCGRQVATLAYPVLQPPPRSLLRPLGIHFLGRTVHGNLSSVGRQDGSRALPRDADATLVSGYSTPPESPR